MNLEIGQYINDGENDLIVCAKLNYKDNWYIYVANEKTEDLGFYEVIKKEENYNFKLVKDEKLVSELILKFAKNYVEEREKEGNPIDPSEILIDQDIINELQTKEEN